SGVRRLVRGAAPRYRAARIAAEDARDRGRVFPRAARRAGRRARARTARRARAVAADHRAARPRLRAEFARRLEGAAREAGVRAGTAAAERPHRPARHGRDRRSVSKSLDGAHLPRYGIGHRVRWTANGSGSGRTQVLELAGDADLLEEPDALRVAPDEVGDPNDRVRRLGRG